MSTPGAQFSMADDRRWVVVRTKPRCEKKLAEYCRRREVPHYLPLRRSVRRYSRRTVEFMVPMFPGYVFAHPTIEQRTVVEVSSHAAQVLLPTAEQEAQLVVELNDVATLEQATLSGEVEVRPEIEIGRRVKVVSGPLAGLSGIVSRRQKRLRLTVNVELVGQSVSVEADVSEVELEE